MQAYNHEVEPSIIDKEKLPELMKELIDLIGYPDTYNLISKYGGHDVYIPKHPSRSQLSSILPYSALEKLSHQYGGTYLTLPSLLQIDIQERNKKIILALQKGESRAVVAEKFGLGIRQIANIRRDNDNK